MPFLSKSYQYTYDNSANCTQVKYKATRSSNEAYLTGCYERKTLSDTFFSHVKEVLQRANLESIVFDNEKENTVTIFGLDLRILCEFDGAASYQYTRPIVLCPFVGTTYMHNASGLCTVNGGYTNRSYRLPNEVTICGLTNRTGAQQISYTIKIYYNTNFVICHYESFLGYEVPLFCIIQGDIINSDKKTVYIGECINYWCDVSSPDVRLFHRLVIPANEQESETYTYYPKVDNVWLYNKNGLGSANEFDTTGQRLLVFDAEKYPTLDILNAIYTSEEQNKNVYMKKVTSWNGLVQYNNVYDTSVVPDKINNLNLSKIVPNTLYTINGTQYYCPGSSVPIFVNNTSNGINSSSNYFVRRPLYLFKL